MVQFSFALDTSCFSQISPFLLLQTVPPGPTPGIKCCAVLCKKGFKNQLGQVQGKNEEERLFLQVKETLPHGGSASAPAPVVGDGVGSCSFRKSLSSTGGLLPPPVDPCPQHPTARIPSEHLPFPGTSKRDRSQLGVWVIVCGCRCLSRH